MIVRLIRTALALPCQVVLWVDDHRPRQPSVEVRAASISIHSSRTSVRRSA